MGAYSTRDVSRQLAESMIYSAMEESTSDEQDAEVSVILSGAGIDEATDEQIAEVLFILHGVNHGENYRII